MHFAVLTIWLLKIDIGLRVRVGFLFAGQPIQYFFHAACFLQRPVRPKD